MANIKTLKITEQLFNDLKSLLDFHNEDTEKQLVICLSEITYSHSNMKTNLESESFKKRLTDEMIDSSTQDYL